MPESNVNEVTSVPTFETSQPSEADLQTLEQQDPSQSLEQLMGRVVSHDLTAAVDVVEQSRDADTAGDDEPIRFVDLGLGADYSAAPLEGRGVARFAVREDGHKLTDPACTVIPKESDTLPLDDQSFDITYSHTAAGWNIDPKHVINEQLRVTKLGGVAVFTELDWSTAVVDRESPLFAGGMAVRAAILEAMSLSGYQPDYGSSLGAEIDEVLAARGLVAERAEVVHQFEGDYKELFLGAASVVIDQLAQYGDRGPAAMLRTIMAGYVARIHDEESFRLSLPAFVTQTVRIAEDQ